MFQANLFGHMHVTQAILPFFRAKGNGSIGFTSSSTAWVPLPFMSHYAASKAALSAYVESLHKEVRPLGIQCIAFECGGFPTHLGQPRDASDTGFGNVGPTIAAYGPLFGELAGMFAADPMSYMPGDLAKAATRIADIIKREGMAAGRPWAMRVALGSDGMESVRQKCEEQLKLVDAWKDISYSTNRDGQAPVTSKEMLKFTSILETEAYKVS
jgi:NAD(P)-dependent dehydrogenase (short-subunit alcohol dehydrogenase family)